MDNLQIPHIKISIKFKSKTKSNKFLNSIKRDLPYNWKIASYNYSDNDTFHLVDNVICFESYLTNTEDKSIIVVRMFIGIVNNYLTTLRFISDPILEKDKLIFVIGTTIELFINDIVKPNKYYNEVKNDIIYHPIYDENYLSNDIRNSRIVTIKEKNSQKHAFLTPFKRVNINQRRISFRSPNNISLSLSVMKKSLNKAKDNYQTLIDKNELVDIEFNNQESSLLFDYFENIIEAIIFGYLAVEAFSNAAIPNNFEYSKTNQKGVTEIWKKDSIERWILTTEKVRDILCDALKTSKVSDQEFWPRFKELEEIRNNLVHQKTMQNGKYLNDDVFNELLQPTIFNIVKSALDVISFFYNVDSSHPYFPLGIGDAPMQIITIENFKDHFNTLK